MRNLVNNEQVSIPADIVVLMLDNVKYIVTDGDVYKICSRHIIDNNCGDGNFLVEIVGRFIKQARVTGMTDDELRDRLETYVHGIDIDAGHAFDCRCRLDDVASGYGIENVEWDVVMADALTYDRHDGKMDIVIGNPPYIRIKDIPRELRTLIRRRGFATHGAPDMNLAFFAVGLDMLSDVGVLSYITPPEWTANIAGRVFRKHLTDNRLLYSVIDLTARKGLDTGTRTMVTTLAKGLEPQTFWYSRWEDGELTRPRQYSLRDCVYHDQFIFDPEEVRRLGTTYQMRGRDGDFHVKNGFATKNDRAFISDYIDFENKNVIDIVKASTANRTKAVYPYTPEGDPVPFPDLDVETKRWLVRRIRTSKRKKNPLTWWLYGKPQALRDVFKDKFTLNYQVKDVSDVKVEEAPAGCGVYSGFYILAPKWVTRQDLLDVLATQEFIDYVKSVGRLRDSGYTAFSCLDAERYLNRKLSKN